MKHENTSGRQFDIPEDFPVVRSAGESRREYCREVWQPLDYPSKARKNASTFVKVCVVVEQPKLLQHFFPHPLWPHVATRHAKVSRRLPLEGYSEARILVFLASPPRCRKHSNQYPPQAARHAVLETLYSRAHRIGLDGISCLLDGLRKNVSFSSFAVVVVCVFVCPASEVVVLAEQQLQGFGDHLRR